MKRYLILIFILLGGHNLYAQHRLGILLSPTMTWQIDTLSTTLSIPSGGGFAGMTYQYQYQAFILQTGLDIGIANMRQKIDTLQLSSDTICYNRTDDMRRMEFTIPIMLGVGIQHFYLLGGVKAIFTPQITTTQRATIAIQHGDDRYYDDYNQMFMDAHTVVSQGKMHILPNLHATLELGARWRTDRYNRKSPIFQMGLFVDYSLLHVMPKGYSIIDNNSSSSVLTDIEHTYVPMMHTEGGLPVNHLYAGIRLSLLFDISPIYYNTNINY